MFIIKHEHRDAWLAQSDKRPTLGQGMISQSVGSSPVSGSVLTAQNLDPASDSVSPTLSDPPPFMLYLSLSQKEMNVKKKNLNCSIQIVIQPWILHIPLKIFFLTFIYFQETERDRV